MYWLGFGHGVIFAFFVAFVTTALTGTFCVRWIGRLAAANRERARAQRPTMDSRPTPASAAPASSVKG
jgi:hypothetical protein